MAMCRQTVQRYGGFPIPAIVVRDAGEALSGGNTRQPLPVTRTELIGYTDFVNIKNGISERHAREIYFSPEENIFSSGGKKSHPLCPPSRYAVTWVTQLHRGVLHLCIFPQRQVTHYIYKIN